MTGAQEGGAAEGLVAPPGVDPDTGEVIDPIALRESLLPQSPEMPGSAGLAAKRQEKQNLETGDQVYASLVKEVRKLELAGERTAEIRRALHGWYLPDGTYVTGAEFEYAETYDEQVRALYERCMDATVKKEDRPKWPGEDVRTSIVNEHIEKEKREKLAALRGEMKALETYITVVKARITGLVTLLSYQKEEMRNQGFSGGQQ